MKRRILSLLLATVLLLTMLHQVSPEADAAEYKVMMTAYEFVDCLKVALSRKTVYNNNAPYNLGYYNGDTISWDCWNLGKTIIWSKGEVVNNYTANTYVYKDSESGLGDWTGEYIVRQAPNCSSDFTNLVPGEWLYMDGHTGYYIGDGQVIECAINWGQNGVMQSQIDSSGTRSRNGVTSGKWLLHGMIPWLDYEASPVVKKTYPSYCIAEVTANASLIKSLPCNATLDASSVDVERATKDTQYLATKLVQNTAGELWYEITAKNGKPGYLYAGDAAYRAQRTDDLKVADMTGPTLHTKGYVFYLNGTVSSTYNQLTGVSAYVYAGSGKQGTQETGTAVSVTGNSFALKNSTIDAKTAFGTLAVGTHTYVVSASYKNYYAKTATTLGENTGTVDLFDAVFSVVSPAKSCTHSYTSAVTTAATCIANGKKTYTCSKCSTSYSEIIAATGVHDYVGKETTAANCVTEGVKTFTCKNCPAKYTQPIPATGTHSWGDWGVTQEATCTSTGTLTRQCSVCKQTETQTVPMIGHNYNTVTVDATCTADGSVTNTCTACGDTKIDVIAAKGHDYEANVIAPTCTEAGYTTYVCHCGDLYTDNEVAALGHSYATVTVDATCTADGSITNTCTACGDTKIGVIFAKGHDYTTVETAPTCTEAGQITSTCSTCGDVQVEETPAMGHSYENGICTVCGAEDPNYTEPSVAPTLALKYPTVSFEDVIVMNVYYTAENLEDVVDMGLIAYSSNVDQWNIENAEAVISGYSYDEGKQMYMSSTNGIAAKNLGDTVYFAVYAELADGTYAYTKLVSYSPKTYAYAQLSSGSAEIKALVVAMLKYGAAAQTFFGHNTDALVDSDLTADQLALIEEYRADMMNAVASPSAAKQGAFAANGGITRKYPTVSFEGAFEINYYCVPANTPVDGVTMYYWNQADYDAAEVLTAENATAAIAMDGTGTYQAVIEGIAAKDLDKGIYVAFVYSDGTTTYSSGVLAYSIGTYCNASVDGNAGALTKATVVYGYCAKLALYSEI